MAAADAPEPAVVPWMPDAPGADGRLHHAAALPLWRRKWNRDEYWRLVELDVIHEGSGTELLDGDIVEVAPQSNLHAVGMSLAHDALRAALGADYWVRIGATLDLSPWSQPDPDLSVVRGSPRKATRTVATSALLVVEISDSTLSHDRGFKASLYATGGIADCWIVNLVQRRLEVRRDPQPDPTQFFGHGYATLATFAPGDRVSPLAMPQVSVAVDDLLP